MSPREKSFWWKIGYLVTIAVLLYPLYLVGTPATPGVGGSGGKLAQLRDEYQLSQKHLGQIDATGETVKLATLGLRGVAAHVLWGKAHVYKMKKDWVNLEATVKQITMLQPNWIFQGWNLSYNVSAEFDGYRDRYYYVIKGAKFLEEGIQHNDHQPRLPWEVGWVLSQKIGRADESKQFRRMFKDDDLFHDELPFQVLGPDPRDNWLVGKRWFREAEKQVDSPTLKAKIKGNLLQGRPGVSDQPQGVRLGKSPLIFRSSAPMAQMNYSDARGNDGKYDADTQAAWKMAAEDWQQYGSNDIRTGRQTRDGRRVTIQLNDLDRGRNYLQQIEQINRELRELAPGLREKIKKEKEAELSDEHLEALDTPPAAQTARQRVLAEKAEKHLQVTDRDVVKRISDPEERARAVKLVRDLLPEAERMAGLIRRYRDIVNFNYWRLRAEVDRTDAATAAHKLIHLGDVEQAEGRLGPAKRDFDEGLAAWRKVLDQFPEALTDETFGEDLMEVIARYRKLLDLRDEKEEHKATYGEDFILADVVKLHQKEEAGRTP
jgi:hypothetical protein